jgi:hypothetical protein
LYGPGARRRSVFDDIGVRRGDDALGESLARSGETFGRHPSHEDELSRVVRRGVAGVGQYRRSGADRVTSSGTFVSRPAYSRIRISAKRTAELNVTVTVFAPADAAAMFFA